MKPDKQLVDVLIETDKAFKKTTDQAGYWPDWWADYLLSSTNFNQLTERDWQEEELKEALGQLRSTYDRQKPRHHWSHFFALRLSN